MKKYQGKTTDKIQQLRAMRERSKKDEISDFGDPVLTVNTVEQVMQKVKQVWTESTFDFGNAELEETNT